MEDQGSDSLPAAAEVSIYPSCITVISEREIKLLKKNLNELSQIIVGLIKEFDKLQKHLVVMSKTDQPSITAKCWTTQVREIFYDTGDYLYDFMHSGKEFKIFKARAEHASERFKRYRIQPEAPSMPMARLLPARPRRDLINKDHTGIISKVEEVHSLMGTDKELKVVAIVGPEGAGKTTLAKELYRRHIDGGGTLQCWAFLRVSAKPDIQRLLTTMFIQIQRKQPSCRLNEEKLIDSIAAYLQDKRYLIIIDDLWTDDVWDIISRAFPNNTCCSRIITTTRFMDVALTCCGRQPKHVFKMLPLSDVQSRKLFFGIVFGSESDCPRNLIEVSAGIIRKCSGLPLATINIASMLPSTLKLEDWTGIQDYLPSTSCTNPSSEWMKEVVNLIFSTLRPHLKTALLYFSMYPVGWIVRKDDLVEQWVVEGFLDGVDEGQVTEEIAGGYFDELVRRGMIQPVDTDKNDEVVSCILHHTIHDIILNKSMEENFVIGGYFQSSIALPDKVRRLSVWSANVPDRITVSRVRSLAFFGLLQRFLQVSIASYRHLRVLILHIWADEDKDCIDLAGIRELLRLRYLKIACNIVVKLPDEIQGQQYLEILEVDATLAVIPWDIGDLGELRILKFAVRELSSDDISVLKELVALIALSVYVKPHVKTTPKMIVLDEGGFLNLKLFTFRCRTPCLLIEESAMPKIEKLGLCFSSNEARQDGTNRITIEHLPSLQEISVKIRGAVAGEGPALMDGFVSNNENNPFPIVQLMESRQDQEHGTLEEEDDIMEEDAHEYPGTKEEGSGERGNTEEDSDVTQDDGTGKDEHNEADTRISTLTGPSSSQSVPVGWGIATAGWILSPVFTRLVDKALSHMEPVEPNGSFSKLVTDIIPQLKLTLEAAESIEDKVFVERLVRELKSNFYELEEILDEVEYDRLESQLASAGPANQGVTIKSSQKSRLREILNKTEQALEKARENIKLDKLPSNRSSQPRLEVKDRHKATSGVPRVQVIGRDENLTEITQLLHDTTRTVIGIYGIVGSGKTTLAQHVYQSEKKENHFQVLMWIHVSRDYSLRDIFSDMLQQVRGDRNPISSGDHSLQFMRKMVKESLHGKVFLLVLDDIWCDNNSDKYKLYELLSLLTHAGYKGSKILVTSRNKNVISSIGHDVEHASIEIPDLSEMDFSNLFMRHALGGNRIDIRVKEILGIGAQIVKMLNGSPLAAALVGGLLRKELTVDHWVSVRDDPYLLKGITGILWLCYKHLDEQARRCFAYCSIFPRRHRFERDDLVRLWVAEGFIEATDAGEMEEIANDYFGELVSASFMQVRVKDSNRGKEYFLVHDLLRDIAEQVSGSDFFRVEDGWRGEVPLDVRHLFVQTSYRFPMKDVVKLEKLRSLIILTGENSIGHEVLMDILENNVRLRKLRVLVVETAAFTLPASIGDQKHIRYLALRWTNGHKIDLPDAFNKLYHMQVLDFGDCDRLLISTCIGLDKLINLRHLMLQGVFIGVDKLAWLESLPFYQIVNGTSEKVRWASLKMSTSMHGFKALELLSQLKGLQKLRGKLHIVGLENVESKEQALEANLADKKGLTELVLEWGKRETAVKLQVDVLEGLCPSEHLEELQIIGYIGKRYPDWMVADQDRSWRLQRLVLNMCSPLVTISGPFFSNLLRLTFQGCDDWDALPSDMQHLEKLTVLIIYRCDKISRLPELPRSLKYLEICQCGNLCQWYYTYDPKSNEKTKHIERKFIRYPRLQDSSEYPDEHGIFSSSYIEGPAISARVLRFLS